MRARYGRRIAFKVFIGVYVVVNLYGACVVVKKCTWSRRL